MIDLVLNGWWIAAIAFTLLWIRQRTTNNATSVDAAWALALGLLAIHYAARSEGDGARRWLVAVLACVWSFRLAVHILVRRVGGEREEDGRYAAMRRAWGSRAQPWFFVFYQGQAFVAVLFSVVFLLAMGREGPLDARDFLGALIAFGAIVGEAIADLQLARWRADRANRGRTCRRGLWRYSRHPNYFFEWLHWWAYVAIGWGAPYGWLTLAGPLLMLLFLFRLTGIPYTEKQALKSRGDDYRSYQRTTSAFIPWIPRENSR